MSPTIFQAGGHRFLFFSREGARMHVHVYHPDGEAKIWMDPSVELAQSHGLSDRRIAAILRLALEHEDEIRNAWGKHFGG